MTRFKSTKRSEMVRIEGPDGQTLAVAWDHASNAFLVKGEEAAHDRGDTTRGETDLRPCRRIVIVPDSANGILVLVE